MSQVMDILHRVKRKLMKMRLQPIRVFCFHHVSEMMERETMHACDWMKQDAFICAVEKLRKDGYAFISLNEAHQHIIHDCIRRKKYAVLTADDGWASLKNILPWLNEQHIPVTLFLNPAYLDGTHFRERNTEQYLTIHEVKQLATNYPFVTIGSHGWEHQDANKQTEDEFEHSVKQSAQYLCGLPNYVPFFAYPWGRYDDQTNCVLKRNSLTPVLMDIMQNYNDGNVIHRELLGC